MPAKTRTMKRPDPDERSLLLNTSFGHVMCHVNMLFFPAILLPLAKRYDMEIAETLGISFIMYLLFGLTALPWGIASDRFGGFRMMAIFYLGSCLACFAAGAWIDSPGFFSAALAGMGLFAGIYHPAALGMISKGIDRVSMGMGYNGIFGSLGVTLAPLLAGSLNWLWGLRAAYFFLGGLNFLGFIIMLIAPSSHKSARDKKESGAEKGNLKAFLVLLAAMTLGGIVYRGTTSILPAYIELKTADFSYWLLSFFDKDFSRNFMATSIVSAVYFASMAGHSFGGRAAELFNLKVCYLLFNATAVPLALLMGFASDVPLIGLALVYFFFFLGMQPLENTLVAKFTPKKIHHSAYGIKFAATFGIGALGVKLAGNIETAYSIKFVFPAMGFFSLLLVGVAALLFYADR